MGGKIWLENSKYEDFTRKDIIDKYKIELEKENEFGAKFLFTIPFKPIEMEIPEEK